MPLSSLGYRITGIDNDSKVVEAALKNGKNFGKDIRIFTGGIFRLTEYFERNSFDVCISGGLLEHFDKEDIKKLVNLQLELAPIVVASMPVRTERTMNHYRFAEETALNHTANGIYRNFWSENEWVKDILKDFCIVVEGGWKKTVEGIRNLREAGIHVMAAAVTTSYTLQYFEETRAFLKKIADIVKMGVVMPMGRGEKNECLLTPQMYFDFLKLKATHEGDYLTDFIFCRETCSLGTTPVIAPNGDVFPCMLNKYQELNLFLI